MTDRAELFNRKIADLESAKQWLRDLVALDLAFHLEDDPAEVVNGRLGAPTFAEEEVEPLRERQAELYALTWSEEDGGCPIGFMMECEERGEP